MVRREDTVIKTIHIAIEDTKSKRFDLTGCIEYNVPANIIRAKNMNDEKRQNRPNIRRSNDTSSKIMASTRIVFVFVFVFVCINVA